MEGFMTHRHGGLRPSDLLLSFALLAILGAVSSAQAQPTPISTCPFTITTSGNYVVTQNLIATGTCITIDADHVALDLNGRSIQGDGTGAGISDGGTGNNGIIIARGTIGNFLTGIDLGASA